LDVVNVGATDVVEEATDVVEEATDVVEEATDVVEEASELDALDDETVVPHAAKITASEANKVPFLNCMFIVFLLMNSYDLNIKEVFVK